MKKLISIVLCMAMLLSCFALFALAVEETEPVSQSLAPAPTIDGVVDPEEYTTSKVWSHADNFANSNAITSGKTLTEYVAHSDDYVYIAFVSTEDVSNFIFYLNASEYILTDFDQCGITSQLRFDLSTQDENTAPTTYYDRHSSITTENNLPNTLRGLTTDEYSAHAKRNKDGETFANVTVEIKISKAAMMEIFEVDSVEYFGYYVDGTKADGSGHYINTRKFTGTTTYTKFSSITQFETIYGVNRGAYYASQSRVLNFVIFGEEPAPYHYCPTTCTCEGVTRSTEFSLTDITQWNQQPSTYVTTKVLEAQSSEAPTIDGVVDPEEYTTSKVWSHADNFANSNAITSGKTLTEYVAHSDDYVYIAFVSTEDVSNFIFYLNASEYILTDFDQCGITSQLIFDLSTQDENTAPTTYYDRHTAITTENNLPNTLRGLTSGEYETYAKRNKDGETFANVTVEIKISKVAMEEIFEVDSVEYFGYYVDGTKADGSGHYINTRKFTGTTTYTEFSSITQFETIYGVNRGAYYASQSRVLNFVIFGEEPAPYHYCPTTCTCEGVTRSTEFSLTDITQWNQLPSTYVTTKVLEAQSSEAPTIDGAVNVDEYTTSKVWSHVDNFANNNAITSGKTLTEYVAHSEDCVYIAFVSTEDVKEFTFYLNASESILTDFDQAGILSTLYFNLDGQDKNTVPVVDSKVYSSVTSTPVASLRGLNADEYQAYARRNKVDGEFANVTVEIKISKAAMMEIFEVDSVEYFGYYVDGAKADDSGHYVNSRKFTGTTTYTTFASMSEFESAYGVNRGSYYTNATEGGRILNFVIFDEEPAPLYYCKADSCSDPKHGERAETFSLTDITLWNQQPSTYLTATVVDAPEEEEPAAPQDPTAPPEPSSTPVKGTYVEGSGAVDTYSVEVTFGSMQFTYRDFDKAWDTSNHVETNVAGTARWYCDTDANKITVTNHSNVAVTATLSYDATNNDVSGSFGNNSTLNLATAFGTTYEQAPTASAYLTLSGTYSGAEDTFVKVGTVTVTITKQQ